MNSGGTDEYRGDDLLQFARANGACTLALSARGAVCNDIKDGISPFTLRSCIFTPNLRPKPSLRVRIQTPFWILRNDTGVRETIGVA